MKKSHRRLSEEFGGHGGFRVLDDGVEGTRGSRLDLRGGGIFD